MAFAEILPGYFTDFGVDAVVGGLTVRGIFDNEYQDVFGVVSGTRPMFQCASQDVADIVVGDVFELPSGSFSVAEIQPDGTGLTRLFLK